MKGINKTMLPKKRLLRQAVLILSHPDGHLEIFGEKNIDVHVARVPVASTRESQLQAEEVATMLLPRRYRELLRAEYLRGVGTTRPLQPSVMANAWRAKKDIELLNGLGVYTPTEEVTTWTL